MGCNPSLPGGKNSEWLYKKGRPFLLERALQTETIRAGEEHAYFTSFVSLRQNICLEISVPTELRGCECCRSKEVCV